MANGWEAGREFDCHHPVYARMSPCGDKSALMPGDAIRAGRSALCVSQERFDTRKGGARARLPDVVGLPG